VAGSNAVELTDADGESKVLPDLLLQRLTAQSRLILTLLDEKGEGLSTELDGMAMASIDKRRFPFVLDSFEQSIHGRTMQRNRALKSGLLDRGSLLNVLDDFAFGCLKLLWGNVWLLHRFLLLLVAARRLFLSLPSSLVVV